MADVLIHLTYWAPACADMTSDDDRLWKWMFDVTPPVAMQRVCARLKRSPDALAARSGPFGQGVELVGRVEGAPEPVPLADVALGLTLTEVETALNTLRQLTSNSKAA